MQKPVYAFAGGQPNRRILDGATTNTHMSQQYTRGGRRQKPPTAETTVGQLSMSTVWRNAHW